MEVHFTPETEKKLKDIATREMLDSRYDDLKSGKVKPIPGDEVEAYFREKSAAARRAQRPG
jgi:hypothetical protein